ncbi:MAG: hypothetical protein Q9180_007930 [Flavoplaca navasiana]
MEVMDTRFLKDKLWEWWVIGGNSPFGSVMSKFGIFIDRCQFGDVLDRSEVGDVTEHENMILTKSADTYISVDSERTNHAERDHQRAYLQQEEGEEEWAGGRSWAKNLLLVNVYGATGSKHGVISSKTCAEITTYAARYDLKTLIKVAETSGYEVLYGDIDSIFV